MSEITILILLAAFATYAWRAAGVIWAGRVTTGSPGFRLASCVSYALLMALIVKMVADPGSANLAATNLWTRVMGMAATACGIFRLWPECPVVGVGGSACLRNCGGSGEFFRGVKFPSRAEFIFPKGRIYGGK